MADFADEAVARSEQHLADALARRKTLSVPFSGFCLACREPVIERRYCDSDCRQSHESALRRSRRQ